MTKLYERLKTDQKAAIAEIVAEEQFPKVYKLGKKTFDPRAASVRIPHSYESWNENPIQLLMVRMIGQYGIVWLEFLPVWLLLLWETFKGRQSR